MVLEFFVYYIPQPLVHRTPQRLQLAVVVLHRQPSVS